MADLTGTAGNDVLAGTAAADTINAGAGNDRVTGGQGNDVIHGEAGNDLMNGEIGDDTLYGELGNDTLIGDTGNDTLYGGEGNDGMFGGGSNDVLYGEAGNDNINGDSGNDFLYGGEGNDTLNASFHNDWLDGGAGNDVLNGGENDDVFVIRANEGSDVINGGSGQDMIRLELKASDVTDALKADLAAFEAWMQASVAGAGSTAALGAQTAGTSFTFASLGVTISVVEAINILVDNIAVPLASFLNQAPQAAPLVSISVNEDAVFLGAVAATDADGDVLSWSMVTGPENGTLTLDPATGAYTYTPAANFNGQDTFTVRVTDAKGVSAEQQVAVSVAAVNDAPAASASAAIAVNEDGSVSGSVAASDIDGDVLSWTLGQGPANGTLVLNAQSGAYVYTPNANYNGSDVFSVIVSDGNGGSAEQQVSVAVAAVNDGPVAQETASLAADEDQAASGMVVASDIDGDTLSFTIGQGPANGSLVLDAATGAYTYTANANYSGSDAFSFVVSDGQGGTATQTVSVGVAAVADAPLLTAQAVTAAVAVTSSGTAGNDVLTGGLGNDTLSGGSGNDTINGDGPAAVISATLNISAAHTDLDGSETLSILISGVPLDASLSAGTRLVDGSWRLTQAELAGLAITASNGSDLNLTVTATATETSGGSASSSATMAVTFARGTNSDILDGGTGNDTLNGGAGNDTLIDGSGNDTANGSSGDDLFISGTGNDVLDGGTGFDTLDMSAATSSITVDLSRSFAIGLGYDTVRNFESVIGGSGSDSIIGNSVSSSISGGLGNDDIMGLGGNDILDGGAGNDELEGGSGNDTIMDGTGNDKVNGGSGNDTIIAGSGQDEYTGGSGFDTLDYSAAGNAVSVDISKKTVTGWNNDKIDGIEKIIGSGFNDSFIGGKEGNVFEGGAGNDSFRGMGGADVYFGGAGSDTFVWYAKDVVSGNKYLGGDRIADFSSDDMLNLREFTKGLKGAPVSSALQVVDTAQGLVISAKISGSFEDVVTLEGVHGLTLSSMLADGLILA